MGILVKKKRKWAETEVRMDDLNYLGNMLVAYKRVNNTKCGYKSRQSSWKVSHWNSLISPTNRVPVGFRPPAGGGLPSTCLRYFHDSKKSSPVCTKIGQGMADLLLLNPLTVIVCFARGRVGNISWLPTCAMQAVGVAGALWCQDPLFLLFFFFFLLQRWEKFFENNRDNDK